MGRTGKKIVFLFLALLILILPALAYEQGCFLHQESSFYCTDITLEQAKQECSFFEECSVENNFYLGESCSDYSKFTACRKIFCKSSCQEEFLGKCASGKIPENKTQEWCSPGCCIFDYFGNNFCEFRPNKGLCEIEAKNRNAEKFIFASPMNENDCQQKCSQGLVSFGQIQESLGFGGYENVSDAAIPENTPGVKPETASLTSGKTEEAGTAAANSESKKSSAWSLLLWLLFALLLGLIVFYLVYWLGTALLPEMKRLKVPGYADEMKNKERKTSDFFNFFSQSSARQEKIQELKQQRQEKTEDKKRQELFTEFGTGPVEVVHNPFTKLNRLVKYHRYRQSKKKPNPFENLERAFRVMKDKEKEILRKKEREGALSRLKELARKKII